MANARKKRSRPSWSRVKAQLKHWDKARLTGLIQDLFGQSQDNRDFLAARVVRSPIGAAGQSIDEALAGARAWRKKLRRRFDDSVDLIREDRER